jgi:hypothetical protein
LGILCASLVSLGVSAMGVPRCLPSKINGLLCWVGRTCDNR